MRHSPVAFAVAFVLLFFMATQAIVVLLLPSRRRLCNFGLFVCFRVLMLPFPAAFVLVSTRHANTRGPALVQATATESCWPSSLLSSQRKHG